jgi:hypothetical protein
MSSDSKQLEQQETAIEVPRPTAAPIVVSLGLALCGAGLVMGLILLGVGTAMLLVGLGMWLRQLLPGRGHVQEVIPAPVSPPSAARPVQGVEKLVAGKPGYRLRLPEKVHPISSGIKGGIVGGLVMPLPALAYGMLSGHGIWYVVNLLAGIVLPGVENFTVAELEQFRPALLVVSVMVHAVTSLVFGLLYGVLMPTLPSVPQPIAWGALLMPTLWTAVSYLLMGAVNPALRHGVDWPWFVASQFVFGVVTAVAVMQTARWGRFASGVLGGLLGGSFMAVPAIAWSLLAGHGLWYPVNLLAGMVVRGVDAATPEELAQFHSQWFAFALITHVAMCTVFGVIYALILPRARPIPAPLAWGGLVLPLLWTAASFGLMGVVNPVLQERVDWPWFIVSQFVFGIAAAIVVVRSELVVIPPAGAGPDSLTEFAQGKS